MRNNEQIISYLKGLKEQQGLTISEIARRTGMAKSAISRYFNGSRDFPLNHVDKFANAFQVTPEDILEINKPDPAKPTKKTPIKADIDDQNVIFTYQGKPLSEDDKALIRRLMNGKEE